MRRVFTSLPFGTARPPSVRFASVPFTPARFAFAPIASALIACACNPLIYDELLEDAWVTDFELHGPTQTDLHGPIAITYPAQADGFAHVLMAGSDDAMMAWWSLNGGASIVDSYPSLGKVNALVNPIKDTQSARVAGLVAVPAQNAGDLTQHALVSFTTVGQPKKSRIVRIAVPAFVRTNTDPNEDVLNPSIRGAPVPDFGRSLAAINLDAGPDEPNYEVMVGSELGPVIFDNLDHNRPTYAANKAAIVDQSTVTGENEANGYGFTLCERADVNGMTAGFFLAGQPAFVVADPTGLTLVGQPPEPLVNLVGAPIYSCDLGHIPAPMGSSPQFGRAMRVDDLNADAIHDLVVGDPGANLVHVYVGTPDGLPPGPTHTIKPKQGAREFGASIGRADLGGKLGATLLVGAPGSSVDGTSRVGKVFVYDITGQAPVTVLADTTPEEGSRYGEWAGGVRIKDRDELVIIGARGGRVHIAVDEDDPYPGS